MSARTIPLTVAVALLGLFSGFAHAQFQEAYPVATASSSVSNTACGSLTCDDGCGSGGGWGRWISLDRLGTWNHHPRCGCFRCRPRPTWASFDALLWWGKGRSVPPLVTTGANGGVLPDAEILFGDGDVGGGLATGARADFGFWFDDCETLGAGAKVWGLQGHRQGFFAASSPAGEPVLARPFFNDLLQVPDSLRIAFPGQVAGDIDVSTRSSVLSTEAYLRTNMFSGRGYDVDLMGGYHFVRLDDGLQVLSNSTVLPPGIPATFTVLDLFNAHNEFHGGEVGVVGEVRRGCWTLTGLAKMSVGNMRQTVIINGSTTTVVPGDEFVSPGGLLANAQTNMGTYRRDVTAWIPEVGVTVAYEVRSWMRVSMGYSALWFSNVVFAGDQIDETVDPSMFATRPAFAFRETEYWLQGLNLGVTLTF
jgi:hypothetical protein